MSEHFDAAFLISEESDNAGDNDELHNANEIFDFAAASEEVAGYSYSDAPVIGESYRQASVDDGDFSDVASNDDDGLYSESMLGSVQDCNENVDEMEDMAVGGDKVYLWKIDYSSGDHKLSREYV